MDNRSTAADELTIERIGADGRGLYVQCRRSNDRFRHMVGVVVNGARRRVLVSREGTPDDDWPCSPPLQQIHRQSIGEAPALLAVGTAGTSHFSTSLLLKDNLSTELLIESACSMSRSDDATIRESCPLGTIYRVESDYAIEATDGAALIFSRTAPNEFPGLTVNALVGGLNVESDDAGETTIQLFPDRIQPGRTTQWAYGIQW